MLVSPNDRVVCSVKVPVREYSQHLAIFLYKMLPNGNKVPKLRVELSEPCWVSVLQTAHAPYVLISTIKLYPDQPSDLSETEGTSYEVISP